MLLEFRPQLKCFFKNLTGYPLPTPHYMDEYQNKGDRKWAIHNSLKTNGGIPFVQRQEKGSGAES